MSVTAGQVAAAQQSKGIDPNYKWKVLSSVVFGLFMVLLDTTVVNVAFQTLRKEFSSNLSDTQWIISIYVMALGVSTPMSGFLADKFGYKKIYLTGLSIFTIGSFLCGISPNLFILIAARALQATGGGIALPLGSAMLFRAFKREEQGIALGIFGISMVLAPALGPLIGGALVDHDLWKWIFFVNVPIGIIGVTIGSFFLKDYKGEHNPKIDVLGFIASVIGFGSTLYAASIAANDGWTSTHVLVGFGVGAAGLLAFILIELFVAEEPLLDLRLFVNWTFTNANLVGYVGVVALFAAEFMLPLYLQSLRGKTAFETGLILLPMAVAAGVTTPLAGRFYDKVGPRVLMVLGFGILTINTWQFSVLTGDTSINWIMFLLVLRGFAVGLTIQTTFVTALSVIPLQKTANGSSIVNGTRQVIQSIAVAILATILASTLTSDVKSFQAQYVNNPSPAQSNNTVATKGLCGIHSATDMGIPASALNHPTVSAQQLAHLPPQQQQQIQAQEKQLNQVNSAVTLIEKTCTQSVQGYQNGYTVTFYAALLAMILGAFLPGWPLKWTGRGHGVPVPSGH